MFKRLVIISLGATLFSCNSENEHKEDKIVKDTIVKIEEPKADTLEIKEIESVCLNDSLNALANVISGITDSSNIYGFVKTSPAFKSFSKNFDRRWMIYDTSRLLLLRNFRANEISKVVKRQTTLFYPFSGPDILYAQTFFPDVDRYVMIGLEPVGSFPIFKEEEKDSLDKYFNNVNTSLNAILKFSFFRTESMSKDLKNEEVNGTLHLLILFLKRTGNQLCSAKPVTVDSSGNVKYHNAFEDLRRVKSPTKGVEIKFSDINHHPKTLYYFSLNAADGGLKFNKGFRAYLQNLGTINTYLKGASYLMHKDYFSIIENVILNQSEQVIQDDSGMAIHYYLESDYKWNFTFYGEYTKPIPIFKQFYQPDLDSLYKLQGSRPIGFGIGYNFKDKNSNFMIVTKKH